MQAGKLPPKLLSSLLSRVETMDHRVLLGPTLGEDAALIDFGDRLVVAKMDPITFATEFIGWYMVQINVNDIAVMGATPRWLMATLLLPEGTTPQSVSEIFDQIIAACRDHAISLIGGHTEVTYGIPRPIAVGSLLGEVDKDHVVLTSGARLGDSIILTKGIAVEGAAILAREASVSLLKAGVSQDNITRARDFLFEPGISVARDAAIAVDSVDVHAMHDPTEGGLATGLMEMATASGTGILLRESNIPKLAESDLFCDALGLDPLGLIASGSLLVAVAPEDASRLVQALGEKEISAAEIGRFMEPEEGMVLETPDGVRSLPVFGRDELARFLGE